MRALVTGATGFIGGNLASALLASNWEVHALLRSSRTGSAPDGIVPHVTDGTASSVRQIVSHARPDTVFHLAGRTSADGAEAVDALLQANVGLGTQILHALAEYPGAAFINAGSFFQNGSGTGEYSPVSLYAASKQAFQDILAFYERGRLVNCCSLTLYDTYGPDDPRGKLFNVIDAAARTGATVDLSPGDQTIHPVYIDDVVAGLIRSAHLLSEEPDRFRGARFSLDSHQPVTVREAVQIYSAATCREVAIRWGGRPYRPFEIFRPWVGGRPPGWAPAVPLFEGLRRTFGSECEAA